MQSNSSGQSVTVKTHGFIKIVGFVGAALFSLGAFMAWLAGQGSVSPGLLVMAAIGLLLPLLSGSVEADDYFITCVMPLWKFEIRWDEVSYIEIDREGQALVFVGEQKRLSIWGRFIGRKIIKKRWAG
jgi:hypothetical protein